MPSLKQCLQSVSKRAGLHNRLKASPVYDLYWSIADKRVVEARRKEVDFYRRLLEGFHPGDMIFDIGANDGSKTDVYLRLGARVIAVEPDELNLEILREKFHKYRFNQKPVVIIGKAVSDKVATEIMWVDGPGSALNTLSQKWVETLREDQKRFEYTRGKLEFRRTKRVETTTLEDLMVTYGLPFYIKIDVEGHEASVLQGLKRAVPFLSFEVNLPEFLPEGLQSVKLLERVAAHGKFNYAGDCQGALGLPEWLDATMFMPLLKGLSEKSIEVFWKTV